jgi:hypothetical protein
MSKNRPALVSRLKKSWPTPHYTITRRAGQKSGTGALKVTGTSADVPLKKEPSVSFLVGLPRELDYPDGKLERKYGSAPPHHEVIVAEDVCGIIQYPYERNGQS